MLASLCFYSGWTSIKSGTRLTVISEHPSAVKNRRWNTSQESFINIFLSVTLLEPLNSSSITDESPVTHPWDTFESHSKLPWKQKLKTFEPTLKSFMNEPWYNLETHGNMNQLWNRLTKLKCKIHKLIVIHLLLTHHYELVYYWSHLCLKIKGSDKMFIFFNNKTMILILCMKSK